MIAFLIRAAAGFGLCMALQAKTLNVVSSLPDYGAIAEAIGGDNVKVTSLATGCTDTFALASEHGPGAFHAHERAQHRDREDDPHEQEGDLDRVRNKKCTPSRGGWPEPGRRRRTRASPTAAC